MRFMRILTAINRFLLILRAPCHNPRHRDRPPRGRPLSEKRGEPRQGAMGLASPVFLLSGGPAARADPVASQPGRSRSLHQFMARRRNLKVLISKECRSNSKAPRSVFNSRPGSSIKFVSKAETILAQNLISTRRALFPSASYTRRMVVPSRPGFKAEITTFGADRLKKLHRLGSLPACEAALRVTKGWLNPSAARYVCASFQSPACGTKA